MALTWAWLWMAPPRTILERARTLEESRMPMDSVKGQVEPVAHVKGPKGAVVIPLRLAVSNPEEVKRLIRQVNGHPAEGEKECRC